MSETMHAKLKKNKSEPVAWMWTLLVDDICQPGGSGGRKLMQTPSFCHEDGEILREVESRWKTKVIDIVGRTDLYDHEAKA